MGGPIDPYLLADVLARGDGRPDSTEQRARQAALVTSAQHRLDAVATAVLSERFGSLSKGRTDGREPEGARDYFDLVDAEGRKLTIWLDAVPMERGAVVRTATNTTSDQYIIQFSDLLPVEHLDRVLAHSMGEVVAVRDRSSRGMRPVRESMLRRGAELTGNELSSQDHGRIAELNLLADQVTREELSESERAEARARLSLLLDDTGMRPVSPVSEADEFALQEEACELRNFAVRSFLSPRAESLVDTLALSIEQLDPADAAALQAGREAAVLAEREVRSFVEGREAAIPAPGYNQDGQSLLYDLNGQQLTKDVLEDWSARWKVHREGVSERTVRAVEAQQEDPRPPRRQVIIGGGASLTGRDPEALLIDDAGRWHLDPGTGLVQSADQDRDLDKSMGVSTHSVVRKPGERIPVEAVRVWEDQLATQGDVVNGRARIVLGENGGLVAEIAPTGREGGKPLLVECEGIPVVATGLTPEVAPGMPRGDHPVESRSEAVRLLADRLGELEARGTEGAQALRTELIRAERAGASAAEVHALLTSSPLEENLKEGLDDAGRELVGNCFGALESTRKWEQAREDAAGRALFGDEVAEGRFDAVAAGHWVIAGAGGTGVANAEIILRQNPDARVTIIGNDLPPALKHQVQYPEMLERYGDRLEYVSGRLGPIKTGEGENGRAVFDTEYTVGRGEEAVTRSIRSDGYVSNLGRTNPLPPALQTLADQVRDRGGEIRGDLLFDRDDQYIGYGLTFEVDGEEHRVNVDGGASWQLPREIFTPESGVQRQLNLMGARALPAETGNAAPGFAPVARQSGLRARALAAEQAGDATAVQRLATVPERWKRLDLGPDQGTPAPGPTPPRVPPAPSSELASPVRETPAAPEIPPVPAHTPRIPEQPSPRSEVPKEQQVPDPPKEPAPAKPARPGPALWTAGANLSRGPKPAAPSPREVPQQVPPGQERSRPGTGIAG